jgi:hypothetical protein
VLLPSGIILYKFGLGFKVLNATFNNISVYIVAVSFIGGWQGALDTTLCDQVCQ